MTESEANRKDYLSSSLEKIEPVTEEHRAILKAEKAAALQRLSENTSDIAYQILQLQQRIEAYERLHREEIAELQQDLDQLRRAFLKATNPQLHTGERTSELRKPE